MPLFSQFKVGQADDEIRTIMATDSHSSLRMIKLMQQQQKQQQRQPVQRTNRVGNVMAAPEDESTSSEDDIGGVGGSGRRREATQRKDSGIVAMDQDEEMQDAVPDVKAVSSSTDSSRLSSAPHRS